MFSKINRSTNSFLKILFISLTISVAFSGHTSAKTPSDEKLVENLMKSPEAKAFRRDWKKSKLFDYTTEPFTNKKMARRAAYHEAGHTLISTLLGIKVKSTEILSKKDFFNFNGGTAGFTKNGTLPSDNDLAFLTLFNFDLICLAGYVAEKIIFTLSSNGFKDDLDKASETAFLRKYFVEKVNIKQARHDFKNPDKANKVAAFLKKNKDLKKKSNVEILKENLNTVTDMINKNINKLHAIAKALLKKRKLSEKEIANLINNTEN